MKDKHQQIAVLLQQASLALEKDFPIVSEYANKLARQLTPKMLMIEFDIPKHVITGPSQIASWLQKNSNMPIRKAEMQGDTNLGTMSFSCVAHTKQDAMKVRSTMSSILAANNIDAEEARLAVTEI